DTAPSTSPYQLCDRGFGAVARTPAMISGRPETAATMRRKRRRVGRPSNCSSGIFHADADRFCLAAQPDRPHQRRTSLLVKIFDLAIEALKALARDDLARRLDRSHGTRVFAQVAGTAAFGTPLEQVEQVQPIEECEHATQWTQK